MSTDPSLHALDRLVGVWDTEATHPMLPGVTVRGTAEVSWLEGERFLMIRARTDHPQFPDSVTVVGRMGSDRVDQGTHQLAGGAEASPLRAHYYDSRGVFRVQEVSVGETAWRWERMVPGFSQRFTGTFADGGRTIVGRSELREDDVEWKDDLAITYRRR